MLLSEAGQPAYLTSRVLRRGGSLASPFQDIFRVERSHEAGNRSKKVRPRLALFQAGLADKLSGGRNTSFESA